MFHRKTVRWPELGRWGSMIGDNGATNFLLARLLQEGNEYMSDLFRSLNRHIGNDVRDLP